ncbi:MAG: T9SS type A sorting domain-containing protein [Bacteroidetes bacterium]|nr:T9SS type A sorting domain-containing protein [Bacteroidota bacterium]
MRFLTAIFLVLLSGMQATAQHHTGEGCSGCHTAFTVGGTVFSDYARTTTMQNAAVTLLRSDGARVSLPVSDAQGRIFSTGVPAGSYIVQLGAVRSRSWHAIPAQRDCNTCHVSGGNTSAERDIRFWDLHTQLPETNDCAVCHHFPASMSIDRLTTPGFLNGKGARPATQGSGVIIRGKQYAFDQTSLDMRALRTDIFAPGYFSLFDVLLAVARREGVRIAYHWDEDCQTHFIDTVDGVAGDFWYGFSYDAGSGTQNELNNRRQIRWDELLWQPGSWITLRMGEDVAGLKAEFAEEIARERQFGHIVPQVQISVNPSDFHGNPPESNRITVTKNFRDVLVTPHGLREAGRDSLHRMPFQPGVVTAIDLLLSLQDQGQLDMVGTAYFTHLAGKVMDSYRVRSLGYPGVGLAHASGRQGFVYTTGNGTAQRLANNADGKQHVHSDIHVIHAPDFARWRWIELGNPYYEDDDPTGVEEMLADYDAQAAGFRLQRPWPQPAADELHLSYNIFEPGAYRITLHDLAGRELRTLFDGTVETAGVHRLPGTIHDLAPGVYFVRMTDGVLVGVQKIVVAD